MEIQNKGVSYYSTYLLKFKDGNSYSLPYHMSNSNCKLMYLESVGQLFMKSSTTINDFKYKDELKEAFELILKQCMGRNVLITLTQGDVANWFTKNFTCYYYHQVPCGYSNGLQHHVLLKNHSDNRAPILPKGIVDKNEMLTLVSSAFEATNNRQKRLELISDGIDAINAK